MWPRPQPTRPRGKATTCATWRPTRSSPATGWSAHKSKQSSSRPGSSRTCWRWTICSWLGATPACALNSYGSSSSPPTLQAAPHHRHHRQPLGAGLGQIPGRHHHGHHRPGPTHAPLRDAGVRGQELPFKGGRRTHRRHAQIVPIRPSCLEQFDWPKVEQLGVAIRGD